MARLLRRFRGWPSLIALGAALLVKRTAGLRSTGRARTVAGRILLWGSAAWYFVLIVSFALNPVTGGCVTSLPHLRQLVFGGIPWITVSMLVISPAADSLMLQEADPAGAWNGVARASDWSCPLIFLGCAFYVTNCIFVVWTPEVLLPNLVRFDGTILVWSLLAVPSMAGLAVLGTLRTRLHPATSLREELHSGAFAKRFARLTWASGAVLALITLSTGMSWISENGGQRNPAEMPPVWGRALAPLIVGFLVSAYVRIAWVATRSRP